MKSGRLIAVPAATAILGLALAACGGSGAAASGGAPATSAPATSAPATSAPAQAASPPVASGLTPPGTHLGFGQVATVRWVPPSTFSAQGGQQGLKLQVAVESIQKGSIADFKNVELNASERKSTPYYVTVRIKALDSAPPPGTDNPAITLEAIDDRGQQQQSITFLGTFQRCDFKSAPKPFTNGQTYESCLAYLMPGGGSIQSVHWNDGPSKAGSVTPYFDHPIIWAGN
jgi:hypothetical protein